MPDSVAKRAVAEAREVTRLAVNAAKNELIEEMTPALKDLIERRLRAGLLGEDVDRLRRAADGYGETEFEEGKDMAEKKDDDMDEGVGALFPEIAEAADDDVCEGGMPEYGATDEATEQVAEGDTVDEEIEISEAELARYYNEGLQMEVDVSKGFKDMAGSADIGKMDKSDELSDEKTGEHKWEDEEPPAKQDYSVKESIGPRTRMLIKRGIAENKALRAEVKRLAAVANENKKLKERLGQAGQKLSEMNLFNSKILHVSKFMNRHRLTAEQKKAVVESLDRATSLEEVKRTYAVLETTFRAAGVVSEGADRRKAKASGGKVRTTGAAKQEVLRESADAGPGGVKYTRWQELAFHKNGR